MFCLLAYVSFSFLFQLQIAIATLLQSKHLSKVTEDVFRVMHEHKILLLWHQAVWWKCNMTGQPPCQNDLIKSHKKMAILRKLRGALWLNRRVWDEVIEWKPWAGPPAIGRAASVVVLTAGNAFSHPRKPQQHTCCAGICRTVPRHFSKKRNEPFLLMEACKDFKL